MANVLHPNLTVARDLQEACRAGAELCFSCGTCPTECPVFKGYDWISPMKLVRLANLGLIDELIGLPEIWHCLQCNSCAQSCPMRVKPAQLIAWLRLEALRRGIVDREWPRRCESIQNRLQRARRRLAEKTMAGWSGTVDRETWLDWAKETVPRRRDPIATSRIRPMKKRGGAPRDAEPAACMTCRGCSIVCPVYSEDGAFDPQRIFRLYNYGLVGEVLSSVDIWLCYSCGRCTETCLQNVQGQAVIACLQTSAVELGYVDEEFPDKWRCAQRELIPWYIEELKGEEEEV